MTRRNRILAGAAALALSACADPAAGVGDGPDHPASPDAAAAPAYTFEHSPEEAGGRPAPGSDTSRASSQDGSTR